MCVDYEVLTISTVFTIIELAQDESPITYLLIIALYVLGFHNSSSHSLVIH